MKLLIDMNLSPRWVDVLAAEGFVAVHWSTVGSPRARDREILDHALSHDFAIFTHDLDFGNLLTTTRRKGPSLLQVRSQDTTPEAISELVLDALHQTQRDLEAGAIVTVDPKRWRIRVLPVR